MTEADGDNKKQSPVNDTVPMLVQEMFSIFINCLVVDRLPAIISVKQLARKIITFHIKFALRPYITVDPFNGVT